MKIEEKIRMTKGQHIRAAILTAIAAALCFGFVTVYGYSKQQSTVIRQAQDDLFLTHDEVKDAQIAVKCKVQDLDANRVYGKIVQYDVTIYNNTSRPIKNWVIKAHISNSGMITSVWNADYYKTDDNVYIAALDRRDEIDAGDTLVFGLVLENQSNAKMPFLKTVTITAQEMDGMTGLKLFWLLVMLSILWLILLIIFIANVMTDHKIKKQQALDRIVIFQTIYTFVNFIDAKDPYTRGHSTRVGMYAREIARDMGLSESDISNIYYAGLLHDAGKISIPDAVLKKPGKLSDEEYELVKEHTTNGARMLRNYTAISGIQDSALYHHERYDGKGYPTGIKGKSIPLYARIINVADSYDAMQSDRVYRKALPKEQVIRELEENSGKQFDPDIVPHMVKLIKNGTMERIREEADKLA